MVTDKLLGYLKDKQFLLVEDDEVLIEKLKKIFSNNMLETLVVKSFYDEALVELKLDKQYDLIIFDIMLPTTLDDFNNTKNLKDELNKHISTIIREEDENPSDSGFKLELEQARERRTIISQEINKYIDQEGGIKLIEEWIRSIKNSTTPPILALTAIGPNEFSKTQEIINKVMKFKNVRVLQKPATAERIIKEIKELIENK
jgi:CheY-like chemotaxis protein